MKLFLLPLFFALGIVQTFAQPTVSIVKDFETDSESVFIMGEYKDLLYLAVRNPYEDQIWVSDGTETGTWLLKTFVLSESGIGVCSIYNEKLYFFADDGIHGYELWETDGTEEGTLLLKDINPNGDCLHLDFLTPVGFISFENRLYFAADDGIHDTELWVTDGTEEGTRMLKDIRINGNGSGSSPGQYFIYHDQLFFSAWTDGFGKELWVTDGTTEGTQMFKDFDPGWNSSFPYIMGIINDKLFIGADAKIWISDGTSSGTQIFKNINTYTKFFPYHGRYYFNGSVQLYDGIWSTDGTKEGTQVIDSLNYIDSWFLEFNDRILFTSSNETTNNPHVICQSDGTLNQTYLFQEIPGDDYTTGVQLTSYQCKLYYVAKGHELQSIWVTDGSLHGTYKLIEAIFPDDWHFGVWDIFRLDAADGLQSTRNIYRGNLYFTANVNQTGWNLWKIEDDCEVQIAETENMFTLSPVPTYNFLTIQTNKPSIFHIIDLTGKVLHSQRVTCTEGVDVSGYRNGLYFVKDENGNVQKFIKSSIP